MHSLLVLPLALALQGHEPPPPPPPPQGPPFLEQARELGLTQDQQGRLSRVLEMGRERVAPLERAMREAQRAVMEAVRRGGTEDLAALNQVFADRHLALVNEARNLQRECLAVLTPEQRSQAATLRPPRPGRHDGPPPGRGPGEGREDEGPGRPPR